VSTETGDERKIKGKLGLEPLNSGGTVSSKNLDKRRADQVTGRLGSISVELLGRVRNASLNLSLGEGTVDTRGSCILSTPR
jgi:hypothetical protein